MKQILNIAISLAILLILQGCSSRDPRESYINIDNLFDGDIDDLSDSDRSEPFDSDDVFDSDLDTGDAEEIELSELCGYEPTTFDEYEDCYLTVYCRLIMHCGLLVQYEDIEQCVNTIKTGEYFLYGRHYAAERRYTYRAYLAGTLDINHEQFEQCIRDKQIDDCDRAYATLACHKRFTGTVEDGGPCYSAYECSSLGASCERDCSQSCCVGTCVPKAKLGEYCEYEIMECEPGLYCSAVLNRCVSGDLGTACKGLDCDNGFRCDRSTCLPDEPYDSRCGTCQPLLQEGDECDGIDRFCGGETMCVGLLVGIDIRCRRISEEGDACDTWCLGDLYCDRTQISSNNPYGVCRTLPGPGEDCSNSGLRCKGANYRCGPGLVCAPRGSIDESCGRDSCGESLYCSSIVGEESPICKPLLPLGSECINDYQCDSFVCTGTEEQPGICFDWDEETCSF